MRKYIRNYVPGGTYFFTQVTHQRITYFKSDETNHKLLQIIKKVQTSKHFELLAYCFIPDHIHLLIQLPPGDSDFSYRMREIKRLTTIYIRKKSSNPDLKVWQDRFWEHTIRDETDLRIHFDYIHYNPVKHGVAESFDGWEWSSYREYFASDYFKGDSKNLMELIDTNLNFGE